MSLSLLATTIDLHSIQLVPVAMMKMGTNLQIQFDIASQGLVLAQQFQSTDILGNIQSGWTDFLNTGKAGALAVGLVMGYMIRGITR
jgi:hypothetical protein